MAKPLKILLGVMGALLLSTIAAAIALPLLFDPNDYRDKIAAAVKKETGREFAVGKIELAVFPWLRVQLQEVTLGNAPGFGAGPMLTVRRADIGARLLPLLRDKRVEASAVVLEGVVAKLAVHADGQSNWQDLFKPTDPETAVVQVPIGQRLRTLDIESVSLSEVSIGYDNQQTGKQYQIDELQLKTGRLYAGQPFALESRFKASAPKTTAAVELSAEVALDADSGDVRLTKPQLKLDASQQGSTALAVKLAVETEALSYAKATETLSGELLTLAIDSLLLGAADQPLLSAKGQIKTRLVADLIQRVHTFDSLDAELQLAGSAVPGGKPQALKLSGHVVADLAQQQARISGLQLAAFGLKASANQWLVSRLGSDSRALDGDLAIAAFEPRALLAALGIAMPQTADAGVLKSASLSTQLVASSTSADFNQLTLKLDDTSLRGNLTMTDFASKTLRFALQADQLNADRYLPPTAAPAQASVSKPGAKTELNAIELPIQLLQDLKAQGTLDVASLKLLNLKLAKVRLKLDGAAGTAKRQQLAAELYGGNAELALRIAPGAPHALRLALNGINAAPLLKDFLSSDKLSGKGSMTLDVTATGRSIGEVRRSLDGKLAFNLVDGAVKGFNLGQILRDGQLLLRAQAQAGSEPQATDFAELRGSGVIVNGVLKSDQLSAKSPLLRLEGAGEIDLVQETINYLARPELVNTATGQGGKERINLSGIVIPVRLSGNLYKPKVAIDWESALKQQAVGRLREKLGLSEATVRENRDELRRKAKEEISKGLLKLFGGSKPAPAEPPPPPAGQ